MRNSKTLSTNEMQAAKLLRKLSDPEIQVYISSLQREYGKYRQPLKAARKTIDDAMKTASLTGLLYESREQ